MQISGTDDRNIVYINLLGSFLAVIFTVILHYPLIPVFSKNVNARIENEVVNVRRSYAIKVLSTFNGKIIAIQQEKNIAISFHPELTENTLIHEYFIKNIL